MISVLYMIASTMMSSPVGGHPGGEVDAHVLGPYSDLQVVVVSGALEHVVDAGPAEGVAPDL